jgi:starch synthase
MACQTAVLASRVGGIPEVVQDGITGELVDYTGDAAQFESALTTKINSLMNDPEKLQRYALAGRARAVNDFSWASIAEQTIELYQSIINKRK